MVSDIQPKIFVMENVPGLVKLFKGKVKDQVIEDFSNLGYEVTLAQLTACDYGVPQARKRVFFVGLNKSKIRNTEKFISVILHCFRNMMRTRSYLRMIIKQ